MKIEMGESLLQSYLKHVENCLVSQTNWKTSSNWNIDSSCRDKLEYIYIIKFVLIISFQMFSKKMN